MARARALTASPPPARSKGASPAFVALAFAGAAVVGLLAFSTFWTVFSRPAERVKPGVAVADVEIGGVQREEVRSIIAARLARYADGIVHLPSPAGRIGYPASELGYRPELEATLAQVEAVGVPLKREAMLAEWAGDASPRNLSPAFTIDRARLDAVVDQLSRQIDRPPADAQLRVHPDTSIELINARSGQRFDRDEFVRRLSNAFRGLETEVPLPVEVVPPTISDPDARKAREAAERFVSGPLEVRAGGKAWTLTRGDLSSWVTFAPGGIEKLRFQLHPDRPRNWLVDRANDVGRPARDARFRFARGKLVVTQPDQPGQQLDIPAALDAILVAAAQPDRRVELPLVSVPPRLTAGDAAKLSFPDLLAESATVYGGSIPERNHNVELATSRLDGAVVMPGETFSFNGTIGRTRLRDGYRMAFGIMVGDDGVQTVPSVAGGICQVATTLFHSAFWAGLPIVERHPHAYWIPKYGTPPKGITGLDTTVDEDAGIDFRFRNSTGAPLLIQAATDGNRVVFQIHGQKTGWEVQAGAPQLTNFVKADHSFVRQEDPGLAAGRAIQVEEARDGFDALVTRVVKSRDGQVIDRLEVKSHYAPSRNLVVVGTRR